MSKMSQLHAELSEQAYELGFESVEQAEARGYTVKYSGDEAFLVPDVDKAQEKVHEAWLEEREDIYKRLSELYNELVYIDIDEEYLVTINDAIEFIRKGEM